MTSLSHRHRLSLGLKGSGDEKVAGSNTPLCEFEIADFGELEDEHKPTPGACLVGIVNLLINYALYSVRSHSEGVITHYDVLTVGDVSDTAAHYLWVMPQRAHEHPFFGITDFSVVQHAVNRKRQEE